MSDLKLKCAIQQMSEFVKSSYLHKKQQICDFVDVF